MLGPVPAGLPREDAAFVADADSVELGLLVNCSHFGVTFVGRASGDSVVGRWIYSDPMDCYPSGPSTLQRAVAPAGGEPVAAPDAPRR